LNVKIKKLEENGSFIKTSIGYLPLDWKVKSLIDVCKEKGLIRGPFGGALKKEFFVAEGYKVYEQKNAIYQDAEIGDYYIDEDKFNELKRFEVSEGDFIVSCSGTIGRIFRIPKGAKKGIINQALLLIKINPQIISSDFFYQYFQWQGFQKRIIDNTQGGAMPNLVGMDIFKKTPIPLPPIEEQQKIADILSIWDKAIELKEKLIEQKKEQKKGLMQRLLTGKVRLPGFEGEWKEVKIKDIGTLKGGSAFPEKYQNLTDGKYPFYKVSDMNNEANNKYMVVASNYIDEDICSELKASVIPSKSIVFAKVGAALLLERKKILSSESCIDNNMMALTVNKNFDYNFVYYLLHTISLSKIANVGALPSLNAKDVYSIKCKIPMDLREQKAIAEFFTLLDREIELLEKELTVIKQQKKGLMQLLLTGKVRVKC